MPTAMPLDPYVGKQDWERRRHAMTELFVRAVIGGAEIASVLVEPVEQRLRRIGEAAFGAQRIAAALSPSTLPKLPWPSTNG